MPEGGVVADLHIARGFDYYTGTVVEGMFVDYPLFGSICSGGRYDHLAFMGNIDVNLPGMGVSIGICRILALLFKTERLVAIRSTPIAGLGIDRLARFPLLASPPIMPDRWWQHRHSHSGKSNGWARRTG